MPDGRLGLIDFGQVKEIDDAARLELARLIVALAKDDRAAVIAQMKHMGFRTKHMHDETLYLHAVFNFDRDTQDITGDRNVQQFMEYLAEVDPVENLPPQYLMAGRSALLLRGMGTLFAKPLAVAKLWEPYARQVLADHERRRAIEPAPPASARTAATAAAIAAL